MATDLSNNTLNKHITNKCLTMNSPHVSTAYPTLGFPYGNSITINIQLSYDSNTPMESDLWDGSFYPISLHRSIEHITSDAKNIKNSLNFMARYIVNKQMDFSKANNLDDFISIGKVVQNFISSVYKANWDTLYTAYINQKQQSQHQSFPGEH